MPEYPWHIRDTGSGVEIALHVQPRARRNEIAGLHGGTLKLRLCAPPVDGAANRAVIEFFASRLHLPNSRLQILSGMKSRDKILRIESISLSDFLRHFPDLQ